MYKLCLYSTTIFKCEVTGRLP